VRVLGLDPGSLKFGYGCIDVDAREHLTYVQCGVLAASARTSAYPRLVEIGRDLELLVDELKPDVVAMEAGFVQRLNAALLVGAARGIAAYIAGRRGLPVREYAPSTVKQAAAGNGAAGKDQVAALVRAQLRMKVIPSPDAGDALAVAICRAHDRT
jgi:crossover junction endodeoxyribonuclease RuvC